MVEILPVPNTVRLYAILPSKLAIAGFMGLVNPLDRSKNWSQYIMRVLDAIAF